MNVIEMVQRLHRHRAWVNRNLRDAASALTDEQLKAAFPIGQGSIWKSLLHLYGAEFVWFEALQGNENAVVPGDAPGTLPGNQLGEGGIADLADLRQKWEQLDHRYADYLAGLSPGSLDETVARYSLALNARLTLRRSDVLMHVCTHAHYTAAQVVNMFRQSGATLPQTMLIAMARQEASRRHRRNHRRKDDATHLRVQLDHFPRLARLLHYSTAETTRRAGFPRPTVTPASLSPTRVPGSRRQSPPASPLSGALKSTRWVGKPRLAPVTREA